MSLGFRHLAAGSCLLALVACGSSFDDAERSGAAAGSSPPASTDGQPGGQPGGPAGGPADGAPDGTGGATDPTPGAGADEPSRRNADGSPVVLSSRALCADVPPDAASRALDVAVDDAVAGDGATPQCTYAYTNAAGRDSTFTLAAMRPADIGGRTGLDAFDFMVDLSRELAGPVDLDQVDLPVGDKAVRITGGALHTGVVASGGHLLTVTVPEADAPADRVDALVAAVARALA